jgi:anaerobic magnesium-protoporphyrin IX monomethyl ester cyclase
MEARMDVLLINPPYQTITSNVGVGHQVPLGLLMAGGAIQARGHRVRLLDAECRRLSIRQIVREVGREPPGIVMAGHAGSTPAHPVTMRMFRAIKEAFPQIPTVYGGVYPSYHAIEILEQEPSIDFVIRGEGEATAAELVDVLSAGPTAEPTGAADVNGIGFRGGSIVAQSPPTVLDRRSKIIVEKLPPSAEDTAEGGCATVPSATHGHNEELHSGRRAILTPPRPPIRDLDTYRIGWNLIDDWDAYRCFRLGRSAIIQFSRGCPHRCTYCGQHEFWVSWRHRDPVKVANEIQWLRQRHDVRFITFADENPTTRRDVWSQLLGELARRRLGVHFFATIRARDIVRDADLLPLYREAGILHVLLGIDSLQADVLREVRKGSTPRYDIEACRLLKANGIFSIIGHIVGLADETPATFRHARRQLRLYEGDRLNAMYLTPHDWTPLGRAALRGQIAEPDLGKWDYRHQVLHQRHMKPWRIFLNVKWMELHFHLRPSKLKEIFLERDRLRQQQIRWVMLHIGAVWLAEIGEFVLIRLGRVWRLLSRRLDIVRPKAEKQKEEEEHEGHSVPLCPPARGSRVRPHDALKPGASAV